MAQKNSRHIEITSDQSSGGDSRGSTLLPMLIAGLILIVAGAIAVMVFV